MGQKHIPHYCLAFIPRASCRKTHHLLQGLTLPASKSSTGENVSNCEKSHTHWHRDRMKVTRMHPIAEQLARFEIVEIQHFPSRCHHHHQRTFPAKHANEKVHEQYSFMSQKRNVHGPHLFPNWDARFECVDRVRDSFNALLAMRS